MLGPLAFLHHYTAPACNVTTPILIVLLLLTCTYIRTVRVYPSAVCTYFNIIIFYHVRNETVRERLGLEPVLKKVERRKECWKEKVESRKGSMVEKVLTGEGARKRLRVRPRKRWRDPF